MTGDEGRLRSGGGENKMGSAVLGGDLGGNGAAAMRISEKGQAWRARCQGGRAKRPGSVLILDYEGRVALRDGCSGISFVDPVPESPLRSQAHPVGDLKDKDRGPSEKAPETPLARTIWSPVLTLLAVTRELPLSLTEMGLSTTCAPLNPISQTIVPLVVETKDLVPCIKVWTTRYSVASFINRRYAI